MLLTEKRNKKILSHFTNFVLNQYKEAPFKIGKNRYIFVWIFFKCL